MVRRGNDLGSYRAGRGHGNSAATREYHWWIAMGGVFKQPHLLKDAPNVGEVRFNISESTVDKVTDAMYGVVNEQHGTAVALN